jgi:hypothetical protein
MIWCAQFSIIRFIKDICLYRFLLLSMLIFSSSTQSFERRQLISPWAEIVEEVEKDVQLIEDGLKLGSRKETLEALLIKRNRDLSTYPTLFLTQQTALIDTQEKIIELEERLAQLGEEYACRIRLFGQEFFGVSRSEEIARTKALISCGDIFDMQLQCLKARLECSN